VLLVSGAIEGRGFIHYQEIIGGAAMGSAAIALSLLLIEYSFAKLGLNGFLARLILGLLYFLVALFLFVITGLLAATLVFKGSAIYISLENWITLPVLCILGILFAYASFRQGVSKFS